MWQWMDCLVAIVTHPPLIAARELDGPLPSPPQIVRRGPMTRYYCPSFTLFSSGCCVGGLAAEGTDGIRYLLTARFLDHNAAQPSALSALALIMV